MGSWCACQLNWIDWNTEFVVLWTRISACWKAQKQVFEADQRTVNRLDQAFHDSGLVEQYKTNNKTSIAVFNENPLPKQSIELSQMKICTQSNKGLLIFYFLCKKNFKCCFFFCFLRNCRFFHCIFLKNTNEHVARKTSKPLTQVLVFGCKYQRFEQGSNHLFISEGGAIFMNFHSMTSSCLFNRGKTCSQTVTYNNIVFLPADTKSIVYKHTFCTTLFNKNRTFHNSVGGWITSVKQNFWLHAICACAEQHSTYKIRWENWSLVLRVWCLGKCVGLGFVLQLEKEKSLKSEIKSNIFHWFYLFP